MFHQIKEPIYHRLVVGEQGCGKDLLITFWITKEIKDNGVRVFSVGKLKNLDYVKIDSFDDLLNARNGILYWHDLDLEFDSRNSMRNTEKQRKLLFLVNQMRKRGLTLYGSLHRVSSVDVKLRSLIKLWYVPEFLCVGDKNNLYDYVIKYTCFNEFGEKVRVGVVEGAELVDCCGNYDTVEEISSIL